MKIHRVRLTWIAVYIAVCAAVYLTTPGAHAQIPPLPTNTTCGLAEFLFLGERAQYTLGVSGDIYLKASVAAGRSYAIMAWAPGQTAGRGGTGANLVLNLYADAACTVAPLGWSFQDYEPTLIIPGHTGDHDSLISAVDGPLYIRVTNLEARSYVTHLLAVETTLFSPWWFTGGTNQAFVEIRNTMNAATTARVTLNQSDGTACGATNVPIAGNGNAAIAVGAIGSCAAAGSGSAQIAFAGTPGGLAANITTIDPVNGTSFDSPFSPRMVWSTFSR